MATYATTTGARGRKNLRMNHLLKLVPALLLLSMAFSCQEYLEDELLSETSADFLYSTPEGLENAVVGLYNLNRSYIERGAGK